MKTIRDLLILIVVSCGFLISGCQKSEKTSEECLKAYEKNRVMYDYVGGMPEECRD